MRLVSGYVPTVTPPSASTRTGPTPSSIPPPNTQTPAAFASRTTACATSATSCSSSTGKVIAPLGTSRGLTNRQIAERLGLSGKTVSNNVSAILLKLGAVDRADAARIARDAERAG